MPELRYDGRVAVITGAGRGLGRCYALLLASRGAKVVVNDVGAALDGSGADPGPAEAVVAEIRAAGGEAVANFDTVATEAGGAAIVAAALKAYGQIDILIPNAGNVRYAKFKEIPREVFQSVLDVHLWGTYNVARPAFPLMCAAGYGRIVLTSSISAVYGNHQVAGYAVSKTGMIGLCNILGLEGEAEGVKCNVILPGSITRMAERWDTSQYPKTMTPELIAPVVAWLAHENCSVTGEMFASIAGRVAKVFLAETPGVFKEDWTVEDVDRQIGAIRDPAGQVVFAPCPSGGKDHIAYSFERARRGK